MGVGVAQAVGVPEAVEGAGGGRGAALSGASTDSRTPTAPRHAPDSAGRSRRRVGPARERARGEVEAQGGEVARVPGLPQRPRAGVQGRPPAGQRHRRTDDAHARLTVSQRLEGDVPLRRRGCLAQRRDLRVERQRGAADLVADPPRRQPRDPLGQVAVQLTGQLVVEHLQLGDEHPRPRHRDPPRLQQVQRVRQDRRQAHRDPQLCRRCLARHLPGDRHLLPQRRPRRRTRLVTGAPRDLCCQRTEHPDVDREGHRRLRHRRRQRRQPRPERRPVPRRQRLQRPYTVPQTVLLSHASSYSNTRSKTSPVDRLPGPRAGARCSSDGDAAGLSRPAPAPRLQRPGPRSRPPDQSPGEPSTVTAQGPPRSPTCAPTPHRRTARRRRR